MNKTISITFITLLSGAALSFAKPPEGTPGGPPPSHEEFMKQFDTNGDGKLSKEEKAAAKAAMEEQGMAPGGPRGEKRDDMLKEFDKDGDGKLSKEERMAARDAMREKMDLQHFDTDGDGKLSDEEKAAAKAAHEQRKQEMLAKFDKDGDGKLSKEERQAAREAGDRFGPPPSNAKGQGKGPKAPPPPFEEEATDNTDE